MIAFVRLHLVYLRAESVLYLPDTNYGSYSIEECS